MSFWYLASPYAKYPLGREAAFQLACRTAGGLMQDGVAVFSPIAHSHPVAEACSYLPDSHEFWVEQVDLPMMRAAIGIIVLRADGWQESKGMTWEIGWFKAQGKPVVPMDPGTVPTGLADSRTWPVNEALDVGPEPCPTSGASGHVASEILREAAGIVEGARNTTHGDKERSFKLIGDLWTTYLAGRQGDYAGISGFDVAQMMVLLKLARSIQGKPVRDHFVDAAGYAGIAGELVSGS